MTLYNRGYVSMFDLIPKIYVYITWRTSASPFLKRGNKAKNKASFETYNLL